MYGGFDENRVEGRFLGHGLVKVALAELDPRGEAEPLGVGSGHGQRLGAAVGRDEAGGRVLADASQSDRPRAGADVEGTGRLAAL